MRTRFVLTSILFLAQLIGWSNFSFAQPGEFDRILRSKGNYLVGYAEHARPDKASNLALDDLVSQISVRVESSFEQVIRETGDQLDEFSEWAVNTYSDVELNEAKQLREKTDTGWRCIRYISHADLGRVFSKRKELIYDRVKVGERAEQENRIADAIKNYYWASQLMMTHPDFQQFRYAFSGQDTLLLNVSLKDRLNHIFGAIKIDIDEVDYRKEEQFVIVHFTVKYRNEKVETLDYTYDRANDISNITSVKDGMGYAEFNESAYRNMDKLRINIEYRYKEEIDNYVLRKVMDRGDIFYPKNTCHVLDLPRLDAPHKDAKTVEITAIAKNEVAENSIQKLTVLNESEEFANVGYYKSVVEEVTTAIDRHNPEKVQAYFSDEGYQMYDALINSGDITILQIPDSLVMVKVGDELYVRSVPMIFKYRNNHKEFVENVNFIFNKENRIDALNYSLSEKSVHDITDRFTAGFVTDEEKYQIIKFLESFKTAYSLKRIDYIESLFTDDALIIVGRVLQKDLKIPVLQPKEWVEDDIAYSRRTKQEYIEKLGKVFDSNEFVNIKFEECQVKKRNYCDEKLFGIHIKQNYFSSNYSDVGYLFLAIDLAKVDTPKIYVRTWTPYLNADQKLINLSSFNFGDREE